MLWIVLVVLVVGDEVDRLSVVGSGSSDEPFGSGVDAPTVEGRLGSCSESELPCWAGVRCCCVVFGSCIVPKC